MKEQEKIPTHDLDSSFAPVQIRRIAHKNPYDFQKIHRHSYFEVFFFENGGGENLIDFKKYRVKNNGCHIVYPGQTHLLNRHPKSSGVVLQFELDTITSSTLERILQERAWSEKGAIVFEENPIAMGKMQGLIAAMGNASEDQGAFWKDSQCSLLHALLFEVCAFGLTNRVETIHSDFYQFQLLVDAHYKAAHSVRFYLDLLGIGEKRLANLSKTHLGISPLQVIHRRILLEAKRLLVLGEKAHKEIAYDLGFDSPASFSAFVKKKTGQTPSEIQDEVTKIHK